MLQKMQKNVQSFINSSSISNIELQSTMFYE